MLSTPFDNNKHSRARMENPAVRPALAFAAGIFLLMTFLVPIGKLSILNCPFLTLTGFPCPFCGFTRSIWAISAGDWTFATINAPLAWLLYAALVIVFAWNAGCLLLGNHKVFLLRLTRTKANRAAKIAIAIILLNWIYRLGLGLT